MFKVTMPDGAKRVIDLLRQNGFEAYIVGGCVRDSILGRQPKDWDICTSAFPEAVSQLFAPSYDVINTGIKHGTVTVLINGIPYEVTTFRTDGAYSDHRHPDSVSYTAQIEEDLARRDFTVNAMAYNEEVGLFDPFGGQEDIRNRVLRCVGDPNERFLEDGLRILRALRFASVYGFSIAEDTAKAIHQHVGLLEYISAERITGELCKLLNGDNVLDILLEYKDVITQVIPELGPCIGFEQNNRFHQYTIYDHIAHAVSNSVRDTTIRMALLLHDIGKPYCYTEDENGGHFYGHGVKSCDIAKVVLNRLRLDNKTKDAILELVLYHDSVIDPTRRVVKRWMNKVGEERFSQLIGVRYADILAHAEGTQDSRIERCTKLAVIMAEVLIEQECFQIKDLKVGGRDIMSLGIPQGRRVGQVLNHLLDSVMAGDIPNEYNALMDEARSFLS